MGEGDGDVGEDGIGVGEYRCYDDGHRKQVGEGPPSSSSSLTSSLDGRSVSPLVLGHHGKGGARAPPRLDLSLRFLLFLRSQILAFHHFLNC